jgi:hypothetical protein
MKLFLQGLGNQFGDLDRPDLLLHIKWAECVLDEEDLVTMKGAKMLRDGRRRGVGPLTSKSARSDI